ncbi:hypothetical protein jhhlp_004143 [Lomentospora prolificans]|uniref:mannan endo-1,6-alpha-mannosidase n=1 Tax=Lomentospora prolificans TaxID=41688 RepID=A0A2N3NAQ2_9PEZI|nr:hypothetical protein jhhlp_004143 [Lomentospora prolificans]
MATDMMSFYPGNQPGGTPGYIPLPYYWWEAGALMGTLVDYWYYTGDTTWNDDTMAGLLFQVGDEQDYMPRNQTHTEGNDDQGFWGLAVMSATEYNFPNPPADKPQWLALAQAVFNTQASRWNTEYCNGGLRWQIFDWNNGFDYKNTISQACFFSLGARLALYTGNDSYAKWAEKTWDWTSGVGYIDDKWNVYDGGYISDNCTELTPYQWTYNIGGFLLGAAAMYNYTEDQKWKDRVDGLLKGAEIFFKGDNNDIMTELACETVDRCNIDQQSFKAYFSRWLANVVKWYPETSEKVMPWLRASSVAAAQQCTGGDNGRMCGLKWNNGGKWDGSTGLGQQMAALEVTLSNLIHESRSPVTANSGGTSQGNPDAGSGDIGRNADIVFRPITAGDRAGAGILTALVLIGLVAGCVFVLAEDDEEKKRAFGRMPGKFSTALASLGIGGATAGFVSGLGKGKEKESLDSVEKVPHTTHTNMLSPPQEVTPPPVLPTAASELGNLGPSDAGSSDAWAPAERPPRRLSRRVAEV